MKNTRSLQKNYEFQRVYSKGQFCTGKYLVLYYLKNTFDFNRLGISTGKKIGKSVVRNRMKRIVKENYRLMEDKIPIGYDLVFMVRKSDDLPGFWDIKREMRYLLKKGNLFNMEKVD
jgi:ribonuclease P protein component